MIESKPMYSVSIKRVSWREFHGPNGEEYRVFKRNLENPLDSTWKWFRTLADAEEYANTIDVKGENHVIS